MQVLCLCKVALSPAYITALLLVIEPVHYTNGPIGKLERARPIFTKKTFYI